ncbi:hypothetical protein [Devosia sp. Leaf64]|uniref:hypothetical protein n=1 Tax=Devosia sp. Leaf64 TaxID=1736229 RepID=UPI000A4FA813|nr:hypothetical protein [Devosia sp. Leaf64]
MNRRFFLGAASALCTQAVAQSRWLAGSAITLGLTGTAMSAEADTASLALLTKSADGQVQKTIEGLPEAMTGSPRGLTRQVRRLVTPFVWADSKYHHDESLLPHIRQALEKLSQAQHDDGTFSVGNRHSPPDTGFLIEDFGLMVSLLEADDHADSAAIADTIRAILTKAGPGLATGGVHTPNHRWKICAALARISHVTGDKSYLARIDQWLAEGMDIDEDGIYSERSPIYYSEVTNPSLLVVAHVLDRPELLDYVRKNLELSIEHADRNGEIEAVHSRRQDQHQQGTNLKSFYVQFRELALLDTNGRFAAMARLIEEKFAPELGDYLGDLIERPELAAALPASEEALVDFKKHYNTAGLVRIRRGKITASAFGGSDWYVNGQESKFFNTVGSGLSTNPTFFRATNGAAILDAVRLVPNFFSMGHFRSNGIGYDNGAITLGNELKVPYYLPMPPERRDPDGVYALSRSVDGRFNSMLDFENRPVSTRDLKTDVAITETENGFDLAFDVSGEDDVELTWELTFREGGELSGVEALEDGTFHLIEGQGTYTLGQDKITFGPGNGKGLIEVRPGEQYSWTNGSLTLKGHRVYITAKSPVTYTLSLGFA